MKTTATNKKVRELMIALREESLVPRPFFQRRLVWTTRHKQLFIKTVLDGYPFPEIFLCDGPVDLTTGTGSQLVVDGQQRITTLYQYFIGAEDLRLGDVQPYAALSDPSKQAFLDYEVVVRDLGRLSDAKILEIFNRMNSTNYSLNAMEVNNARYNGELKQFAEEVSGWPFFDAHRVFSAPDVRRMVDVRWTLTLVISVVAGYFNRDVGHEQYLKQYNDEFPMKDRVKEGLTMSCDLIDRLDLGDKSRAWQKNDLLTLLVEIYRKDPRCVIDESELGESLRSFYEEVNRVSDGKSAETWGELATSYHAAVISGSNERARRMRRGAAIETVLKPHFNSVQDPDAAGHATTPE